MCLSPTPAPVARPVSSAPTTPDGDPRFDLLSGAIRLPRPPRVPLDVLVMDAHWLALDEAIDAEGGAL